MARDEHYTVPHTKARGIFCLETDWTGVAKAPSVFSLLGLLRSSPLRIPSIHRHVATQDSFHHYLEKWVQVQHGDYPILYLALHGVEGEVQFGDLRRSDNHVTLDELEKALKGRCRGRVLHFSSCRTLVVTEKRVQQFLKATGAVAVSGYRRDIDWIRSAVFDLGLLACMQQNAFTAPGLRAVKSRVLRRYGGEAKALQFRMFVRASR
ncbi:MAG: hypothetical protein JNM94_17525 [Phycisphaerae bacterium]|nr:hypothetical protein [Phycisphaerae bacterium]